jgi:hypothetical protein
VWSTDAAPGKEGQKLQGHNNLTSIKGIGGLSGGILHLKVVPNNSTDAHRPLDDQHDLAASLSVVETRQVTNDYTIRLHASGRSTRFSDRRLAPHRRRDS